MTIPLLQHLNSVLFFLHIYTTSLLVRLDFLFCQNNDCTSNINMYGIVLINIINSQVQVKFGKFV